MTLDHQLQLLKPHDLAALMYAFEQGEQYLVKLKDNRFIGVHVQPSSAFVIEESQGVWSQGHFLTETK